MKAIWNGEVIAESDNTIIIETNHYFPADSIKKEFFKSNENHSTCSWKGEANYYDLVVNGDTNADAAWYYPKPKDAANEIKDRVAFWRGVKITS